MPSDSPAPTRTLLPSLMLASAVEATRPLEQQDHPLEGGHNLQENAVVEQGRDEVNTVGYLEQDEQPREQEAPPPGPFPPPAYSPPHPHPHVVFDLYYPVANAQYSMPPGAWVYTVQSSGSYQTDTSSSFPPPPGPPQLVYPISNRQPFYDPDYAPPQPHYHVPVHYGPPQPTVFEHAAPPPSLPVFQAPVVQQPQVEQQLLTPPARQGEMPAQRMPWTSLEQPAEGVTERLARGETVQSRGTVKFFSVPKGYGFIVDGNDGLDDIFVHYTGIEQARGFRCLAADELVEYALKQLESGRLQAFHVKGVNGQPLIGLRDLRQFAAYKRNINCSHVTSWLNDQPVAGLSDPNQLGAHEETLARSTAPPEAATPFSNGSTSTSNPSLSRFNPQVSPSSSTAFLVSTVPIVDSASPSSSDASTPATSSSLPLFSPPPLAETPPSSTLSPSPLPPLASSSDLPVPNSPPGFGSFSPSSDAREPMGLGLDFPRSRVLLGPAPVGRRLAQLRREAQNGRMG
ncbi:hypothetical protein JCM8547_005353 [Rhodosporidiobolus lusitaniae]